MTFADMNLNNDTLLTVALVLLIVVLVLVVVGRR
jgi:hypothetical protein